uniref:Uncharacterized protein n=1 Tax=Anguilla anguilla TaxID=7936 RepID=A0A0E9VPN2_ANGAN
MHDKGLCLRSSSRPRWLCMQNVVTPKPHDLKYEATLFVKHHI